jgi:hypothetical protein
VIAGVTVAVARQALIAHEKAGTAVRLKGGRTGVPETWQPVDGELAPGPDLDAGRLVRGRRPAHSARLADALDVRGDGTQIISVCGPRVLSAWSDS